MYMGDDVLMRLKKVRGQIDGVIKMYEDERDCVDVVTQISAARSALAGVGKKLLSCEAVLCTRSKKSGDFDRILKQLFELS